MNTKNENEVIDLTPKQIKDKSFHKLTNADISANYLNDKFHLMINDFKGSFVCWATRQNPNGFVTINACDLSVILEFAMEMIHQKLYGKDDDE